MLAYVRVVLIVYTIPTLPYFVSETMAKIELQKIGEVSGFEIIQEDGCRLGPATMTITPKKDQEIPDHVIIEGLKVLLIQSDKKYYGHCKTNTHSKAKCRHIQYGKNKKV